MTSRSVNKYSRFLLLFLAVVLLLPFYGGWINIHYAAFQPNHQHIYLGKVNLNHHRTSDMEDIVMLPDQDATSQIMPSISLPDQQIAANMNERDELSFDFTAEYHTPEDAYLPPPDYPPRTTANPKIS
jgi:hypothetical protein